MTVQDEIDAYIAAQNPKKRDDMQALHRLALKHTSDGKLWFLDGRNEDGKIVTNPNVGYGSQTTRYANGETREFYRIGLSANTTGISVYVMGLADKRFLADAYAARLGKAKITGYCIKFRTLSDINLDVLEEIIASHLGGPSARGARLQSKPPLGRPRTSERRAN